MVVPQEQNGFISTADREGLYRIIFSRRDVRGQFKPDPIPDEVISRILYAAHHAPSVGFMQPWNFIIIKSKSIREEVHGAFNQAHHEAAKMFPEPKRKIYSSLKLEGILEAPLNICLTCDRKRTGPVVIGRTHIKEMDAYSSVCAIQNLWLAARAEGLGVGWVSILNEQKLKDILNIPEHVIPIGYLCIGHVTHFQQNPELESVGWLPRLPLDDLIYFDRWNERNQTENPLLLKQIRDDLKFPEEFIQQLKTTKDDPK
jgi:5,6-dimethylbenzimidazole synthase